MTRDHGNQRVKRFGFVDVNDTEAMVTKCLLGFCGKVLKNVKDLLQHMNGHILDGNEVQCPFEGCLLKLRVKLTFSSHLSRKHGDTNRKVLPDLQVDQPCNFYNDLSDLIHNDSNVEINNDFGSFSDQEESSLEADFTELFLKSLALFYLKLTAKYRMPATTMQMIVSERMSVYDLS